MKGNAFLCFIFCYEIAEIAAITCVAFCVHFRSVTRLILQSFSVTKPHGRIKLNNHEYAKSVIINKMSC